MQLHTNTSTPETTSTSAQSPVMSNSEITLIKITTAMMHFYKIITDAQRKKTKDIQSGKIFQQSPLNNVSSLAILFQTGYCENPREIFIFYFIQYINRQREESYMKKINPGLAKFRDYRYEVELGVIAVDQIPIKKCPE